MQQGGHRFVLPARERKRKREREKERERKREREREREKGRAEWAAMGPRLLYHSTTDLRVTMKKRTKKKKNACTAAQPTPRSKLISEIPCANP